MIQLFIVGQIYAQKIVEIVLICVFLCLKTGVFVNAVLGTQMIRKMIRNALVSSYLLLANSHFLHTFTHLYEIW